MNRSLKIVSICLIFLAGALFSSVMKVSAAKEAGLEKDIVEMARLLIQESIDNAAHLDKKLQQCKSMGQDINFWC